MKVKKPHLIYRQGSSAFFFLGHRVGVHSYLIIKKRSTRKKRRWEVKEEMEEEKGRRR